MFIANPRVSVVTQSSFASFIGSAELTILRVDTKPLGFHRGITDYLDTEYPGKINFGIIDRDTIPHDVWWKKHFSSIIPDVGMLFGVRTGFYMFQQGKLIRWHSGQAETTPEAAGVSALIGIVGILTETPALTRAVSNHNETQEVKAFLAWFEQNATSLIGSRKEEPSLPKPTTTPRQDDPYSILGVPPTASDEEVKKAHRKKISLNHPDKVAHLSIELREAAEQQTKRIQSAYELVMRARGRSE